MGLSRAMTRAGLKSDLNGRGSCGPFKKMVESPKDLKKLDRYIDVSTDMWHDVFGLTGPNRENAG